MKHLRKIVQLTLLSLPTLAILLGYFTVATPVSVFAISDADAKTLTDRVTAVCTVAEDIVKANKTEDKDLITKLGNVCNYGPVVTVLNAGGYDKLTAAQKTEWKNQLDAQGGKDAINEVWLIAIQKKYLDADGKVPGTNDSQDTQADLDADKDKLDQSVNQSTHTYQCGATGKNHVGSTVFDFGCKGNNGQIESLLYAIIRFVTYGVGIIITFSIVISGIQYTTAQGDAQTVHKARMRIFNAVIALLLYIFAFAILNYLVPGGLIS